MPVTVFVVPVWRSYEWVNTYVVSDGRGPAIERASSTVAGTLAAALDVQEGVPVADRDLADLLLRLPGATERRFAPASRAAPSVRRNGTYLAELVEVDPETGRRVFNAESLFVGIAEDGEALTAAFRSEDDARSALAEAIRVRYAPT